MNEALHQFHFLRPLWLLGLLGLPLALAWLWRRSGGAVALSRLVDASLLPHLLVGRPAGRGLTTGLLIAGWLLAALAFAGPTWSRVEQPLYAHRAAQVVAISMSQRMLARDVAPSRLDRAKYKTRELLARNRDGQNALIAYAGQAFVVAPLTADFHSLNALLDALAPDTMPVDGDNAADAIARGVSLITQAGAGSGSLVLVTDRVGAAADAAARRALAAGVHVSVLGVGSKDGGPVPLPGGDFIRDAQGKLEMAARDDAGLRALAAAGGGRYVPMSNNGSDITALHGELRSSSGTTRSQLRSEQWQDRGPWLLLPLLLIAALAFRRGWLLVLPLVALPLLSAPAHAGEWSQLWQRRDQQAASALRAGHAEQARKLARDPALRGAADYRAGDFAASAAVLQALGTSDAQYNRGNALAKQQQYKEAIAAYDRALKLNPANADAKANRKAVEDWLKKQQQKKPDASKSAKNPQDKSSKNSKPADDGKGGQQGEKKDGQKNDKPDQKKSPSDQGQPSPSNGKGSQRDDQTGKSPEEPAPQPQSAQQKAADAQRAEQARQALQKQMDKQLGEKKAPAEPGENAPAQSGSDKPDKDQPHQLGMPSQNDPASKLPANLRRALQRVPDDPGGLLRRKFQLEYQERQGQAPDEDDQP